MPALRLCLAVTALVLALSACGSSTSAALHAASPPPRIVTSGLPHGLPAPPGFAARVTTVYFAGLPRGAFPVHLHSRCSAAAGFHLAVIGFLAVGADGQGAITVPPGDFGRGWCLIVYGNDSLQSVLTTRAI